MPNVPPERGELVSDETRTEQNAEDRDLLAAAVAEVDRYRSMDRLVPSTHNIVTIAALEVSHTRLLQDLIQTAIQFNLIVSMANLIPNDSKPFLACSRFDYIAKPTAFFTKRNIERVIIHKSGLLPSMVYFCQIGSRLRS